MELPWRTTIAAIYLSLTMAAVIYGMPTDTITSKDHSSNMDEDDMNLKDKDHHGSDGMEAVEALPTFPASEVKTIYDNSELATALDTEPITQNYESVSAVEETVAELSNFDMTDPPIDEGAPKASSASTDIAPISGSFVEEEEDMEDDMELVTETASAKAEIEEDSDVDLQKPAELRKHVPSTLAPYRGAKIENDKNLKPIGVDSSNAGIGTVFSLSDDFTDAELAIGGAPSTANESIDEMPVTMLTESVKFNSESDDNDIQPLKKEDKTNLTDLFELATTSDKMSIKNDISTEKSTTKKNTTAAATTSMSAITSQFSLNDTVLDVDETVDVQLVASNIDAKLTTEDDSAIRTSVEVTTVSPSISELSTTSTVRPFVRRTSTSRPSTSPRPTIRRRITSTTEMAFSIITTTTESHATSHVDTTQQSTTIHSTSLNKDREDAVILLSTSKPPSSTTISTTTITKKQYLVTVPPLEDDFTETSQSNKVEEQENTANTDSEVKAENETPSSATSFSFNGLWNLFSVEATNAIIISGIIGGCAIIFFSILMVFCMWRQHVSRRPAYPPTESSNCSSNSSTSFPASKSG